MCLVDRISPKELYREFLAAVASPQGRMPWSQFDVSNIDPHPDAHAGDLLIAFETKLRLLSRSILSFRSSNSSRVQLKFAS